MMMISAWFTYRISTLSKSTGLFSEPQSKMRSSNADYQYGRIYSFSCANPCANPNTIGFHSEEYNCSHVSYSNDGAQFRAAAYCE